MSEIILPGYLHRESEFVAGLNGTCGPNALASAGSWSDQKYVATLDVYNTMRAHGLCDPSGASTIGGLHDVAGILGYTVVQYQPYGEPWGGWKAFFLAALERPDAWSTVYETANGQAFVDFNTGKGENATNLHYHYVNIVGYNSGGPSSRPEAAGKILPEGFWVCDGDNYDVGNVLQFYPLSVVAASQPCAALSIAARVKVNQMGVPAGWHDDGTTLTAPNGVPVVLGFRMFVMGNNWDANNWPLAPQYHAIPLEPGNPSIGGGDRIDFRVASLGYTPAKGVYQIWLGQDVQALDRQVGALNGQLASSKQAQQTAEQQAAAAQAAQAAAETAAKDAEAKATQLQAELDALKAQPPVVPAPAGADEAIAAVKALEAAIKAVPSS